MLQSSLRSGPFRLRPWLLTGCLGLLALAPVKPAAADPPAVAGVTWTPTFCDKFPGTTLDVTKWESGYAFPDGHNALNGGTNDYNGYFDGGTDYTFNAGYPYYPTNNPGGVPYDPRLPAVYPANPAFPAVTVDVNGLSLRTKREPYKDWRGVTHDYTSGTIQTDRSFAQTYGYFECNFQVATQAGIDSAFWLYTRAYARGDGSATPGINELDVVEVPSGPYLNNLPPLPNGVDTKGDIFSDNVHITDDTYLPGTNQEHLSDIPMFTPYKDKNGIVTPLGATSHLYGMDWEPGTITFYIDGKMTHQATYNPLAGQSPMFMFLNQELQNDAKIGGNWFGDPTSLTPYPDVFAHARWVKAWTRSAQAPYPSLPSFPGTVQAANYDAGGPGISYNQTRQGYSYSYNRPDQSGAAFSNSANGSTPDGITQTSTGQWYKYTVNVQAAGTYTLSFAVNTNNHSDANGNGVWPYGGKMHLEDWNTATATGSQITDEFYLNSPQTSGTWWPLTVSNSAPVHLSAGTHVFRWVQDFRDYSDDFSLYSMTATLVKADEGPYNGPHTIPGSLNAGDYDTGGQGVAYNQVQNGGQTGYRADNSSATFVTTYGAVLGWTTAGQWYKYSVNVPQAGTFPITFTIVSPYGGKFHLEDENAHNLTGTVNVPLVGLNSNDWSTTGTVTASVTLSAGPHILRFVQDTGGYDLYKMAFTAAPIFTEGFESGNLNAWNLWVGINSAAAYTYTSPSNISYFAHSGSWGYVNYSTSPYQLTLYKYLAVPNGPHTVTAWVRSSGGQYTCQMEVTTNGVETIVPIPAASAWTQISTTVNVTTGSLEVGFYSNAAAYKWLIVDDVAVQ